jgi:hypothetical protein
VTTWTFRFADGPTAWDWSDGAPDPRLLLSIRTPRSTEKSRHIPVQAYSLTLCGSIRVESGVEHDLVRELDRDPDVAWMVSQPLRLRLVTAAGRPRVHTPDLLSLDRDDQVTIWDVRPAENQDEKFAENRDLASQACADVGWQYRVYDGGARVRRYNVRWLTAYRMPMPWYPNARQELIDICSAGNATVGTVLEADRGAGHLTSAMWHYAWTGFAVVDLDQAITRSSGIAVHEAELA